MRSRRHARLARNSRRAPVLSSTTRWMPRLSPDASLAWPSHTMAVAPASLETTRKRNVKKLLAPGPFGPPEAFCLRWPFASGGKPIRPGCSIMMARSRMDGAVELGSNPMDTESTSPWPIPHMTTSEALLCPIAMRIANRLVCMHNTHAPLFSCSRQLCQCRWP